MKNKGEEERSQNQDYWNLRLFWHMAVQYAIKHDGLYLDYLRKDREGQLKMGLILSAVDLGATISSLSSMPPVVHRKMDYSN